MQIKIKSKSKNFPTYLFNRYVGQSFTVIKTDETPTEGVITGKREKCRMVLNTQSKTGKMCVPIECI